MKTEQRDQQIPAGDMLREWRQRRRYSQLALALEVEISQRHLSFVESGRSTPSRDMILRLAEFLQVPLRARNAILVAAGFAPSYRERAFASPELEQARAAIDQILTGHEPHPALAVDRAWTILSANRAVAVLTEGVAPWLLAGDVNALRLSLHPDGLAHRIINFSEWRAHILARLAHDIDLSADPRLIELLDELKTYPAPYRTPQKRKAASEAPAIAIPLTIQSREGPLSFLSATTVFGTAVEVTLADIVVESFLPADPQTAVAMRKLVASR